MAPIDSPLTDCDASPRLVRADSVEATSHAVHLDALRGLAALVVLGFHARVLFFVERTQVTSDLHGGQTTFFYLVTAFGREAVLAFFVLSGFLIAASVRRDHVAGRWSVGRYAVARLSRLYVVLLPALLLGLAWDYLGLGLFPTAAVYHAALVSREFPGDISKLLGAANIFGTIAFLQSIAVESPGSSGQFWSLAYEFWCYLLFPLVYVLFERISQPWQRAVAGAVIAAVAWGVGSDVLVYFGCWLMGAAAALLPIPLREKWARHSGASVFAGLAVALLTLYLIKQQGLRMPTAAFALAIGFAILVAGAATLRSPNHAGAIRRCYETAARWLAQRSFSLYATHLPVLVFLRAWCGDALWQPTLASIGLWLVMVVACVVYADLVWRLAERHTPAVRRWLLQRI